MITTIEVETTDARRARVFFADLPSSVDVACAAVVDQFWEEETDIKREARLREILAETNVRAIVFPTYGMPGTLQLFLREPHSERRRFACVLVTGRRLRELVERRSPLVEGFSLQVMPGEHLSMEGVRSAIGAWVERCFPGVAMPSITVQRWLETATPNNNPAGRGLSRDLLDLLLSRRNRVIHSASTPENAAAEVAPDPKIVEPPYEVAA